MNDMKVSIVTVCYNSAKHIKSAIDSVINQSYDNIEYIIIDGASKDNTLEIIQSYGNKIAKVVSEPDKGIYDAMNKGLKMATGDVVGIINSDDFYMNNNVIADVVKEMELKQVDSLFADLIFVEENNTEKQVRYWKSKPFVKGSFFKGWHPSHPTFFVKNKIYKKYGYFKPEFTLAADFELMLRFLEKYNVSACYLPQSIVKMRLGGASNGNLKSMITQNKECYNSFKVNDLNVSILYPIYRLLPKLIQYFK